MMNEKLSGLWVYCEQSGGRMKPVARELLGEAAQLARKMKCAVTAVVMGDRMLQEASAAGKWGAEYVLYVEDASLADPDELRHADELTALIQRYHPAALLMGATAFGRSLAPRVAARLQTGLTADCTKLDIDEESGLLLQTRPAFGGNLMATIICPDARPQMATVRPRVFSEPAADETRVCTVIREKPAGQTSPVELLEKIENREEINIGDADVLVAVGQGIGGVENIKLAELLARRLGGTLAASRPMVDSGQMPYARQVGQTGKTVAPKLYIALGISGAVQHMAGVAAENIVAVNTDPDAPIFQYARYAIVADCGAFLRQLT